MLVPRRIAILLLVAIFICVTVSGRGGGGRGGGSRGGGRSSGSRTSSSRYSGRLPKAYNARGWSSRTKRVAIRAGSIYIASRLHQLYYRDRSYSYDKSLMSLDICRNIYRYPRINETQKVYGWFLCPTAGYGEKEKYCCGKEDKEYCCGYWETSNAVRDTVFKAIGGAVIFAALVYYLCKNPKIIETILGLIVMIICCPCNYLSRHCVSPPRRPAQPRERRRSLEVEAETNLSVDMVQRSGEDDDKALPPPPSYDSCVTKGLISGDAPVDFEDGTGDTLGGNHCGDLPYPLSPSSHNEASAPCAPSSTYRPPSPPTYRSASSHYRSSSPAGGRSSPAGRSISSNRS